MEYLIPPEGAVRTNSFSYVILGILCWFSPASEGKVQLLRKFLHVIIVGFDLETTNLTICGESYWLVLVKRQKKKKKNSE